MTMLWLGIGSVLWAQVAALPNGKRITPVRGLVVAETERAENGEREALTTIEEATSSGVRYGWRFRDMLTSGDTIMGEAFRFVSAADLATAPRAHFIYDPKGPEEHPGTTAWSVSSAVYQQLVASGSASFQIMSAEPPPGAKLLGGLGFFPSSQLVPVRWRGTLTRASARPESFPVLLNGRRVTVPALHVRGQFLGRGQQWTPEFWVLADSAYPMLLKVVSVDPPKALQIVRIDLPDETSATSVGRAREIERDLASACRVELPGVYFAFNSAALDPASDRALASVADILARHRDWSVVIEGHTDSIGGDAPNRALSEQRAAAVRDRLVTQHRIDGARLRFAGYGASKPREPNETIEGRARNRRVELARTCGGAK
jgi:outer membrane protein OmpA-like peptidoglycan-associated protein